MLIEQLLFLLEILLGIGLIFSYFNNIIPFYINREYLINNEYIDQSVININQTFNLSYVYYIK